MYALLIAKDPIEQATLSLVLQQVGLAVSTSGDLESALRTWLQRPSDLIVLTADKTDPKSQILRIRAETEVPLVLILDQVTEALHFELLEARSDLVVPRPFSSRLLVAQIRALLRRAGGVPVFTLPALTISGLSLDPATRTVRVEGHPPQGLTNLEFRLLYTLMINNGQVLPSDVIVQRVWGYSGDADRDLVRGLISRVRSKIEPDSHKPHYIINVPGVGYTFQSDHP